MPITVDMLKPFVTSCFVETGTGSGDGVRTACAAGFPEVRTIEALEPIVTNARRSFAHLPVTVYSGESQKVLLSVMDNIEEPVTIFFDAHYNGPGSFMGEEISPLMKELETLKGHSVNNHILLIDDIGLFGRSEIPNLDLEVVKKKVLEINDKYEFIVSQNILICKAPIIPPKIRKVVKVDHIPTDNIYPYIEKILANIENAVFFEVGAANGEDTARISKMKSDMKYYAFEPDTRNIESFKAKNIQNVNLIESAIGSYNGKAIFYMSSGTNPTYGYEHTLSSSMRRPRKHLEVFPWCKFDKIVNVNVSTLDTFCKTNKISGIDFLWVDIQGAESDLIKGGRKTLANTAYVYLEYSSTPMYENQFTYEQLVDLIGSQFEVVHKFSGDVLFRNKKLTEIE